MKRTQQQISSEIEAADKAVSSLREARKTVTDASSLAARRLDNEIEEGLSRLAKLNDEWMAAGE